MIFESLYLPILTYNRLYAHAFRVRSSRLPVVCKRSFESFKKWEPPHRDSRNFFSAQVSAGWRKLGQLVAGGCEGLRFELRNRGSSAETPRKFFGAFWCN